MLGADAMTDAYKTIIQAVVLAAWFSPAVASAEVHHTSRPLCLRAECEAQVKRHRSLYCSRDCMNLVLFHGAAKREHQASEAGFIECKLCGRSMKSISNSHLRWTHGIDPGKYLAQFPGAKLMTDEAHAEFVESRARVERGFCARPGCSRRVSGSDRRYCSHRCYTLARFRGGFALAKTKGEQERELQAARRLPRVSVLPLCVRPGCENRVRTRGRQFCSRGCALLMRARSHVFGPAAPNYIDGRTSIPKAQKQRARERDAYICQRCGADMTSDKSRAHVHHLIPARCFDDLEEANRLENLTTLCRECHMVVEWEMVRELYRRALVLDELGASDPSFESLAAFKARLIQSRTERV